MTITKYNKLLKTKEMSFMSLEDRRLKRCQQGLGTLEVLGGNLDCFFLVSGGRDGS